jgi:hypothetical protein
MRVMASATLESTNAMVCGVLELFPRNVDAGKGSGYGIKFGDSVSVHNIYEFVSPR